jgi:hypothetical protein
LPVWQVLRLVPARPERHGHAPGVAGKMRGEASAEAKKNIRKIEQDVAVTAKG